MIAPYYQDDLVALFHGDALDSDAWLEADVLVTDPPYGIAWTKGQNNAAKSTAHAGILGDEDTAFRDEVLQRWGTKPAIVFGAWQAPPPAGRRQTLIWRKPVDAGVVGSVTGYRRDTELIFLTGSWPQRNSEWSSVIETNGGKARYLNGHPHAKPDHLMQTLIERAPAGRIADPSAGSGSTLVAAKALGRPSIGFELEERYCELAASRLSQDVLDFGEVS